jgi:hypothetical protein
MNDFKLKTKANIGVTTVGIYTVPASTSTTILGITLANVSGSGINVTVGISRTSADDVSLIKNVPIPQGSSLEFMQGNKIILESDDAVTVKSDVLNSLDVSLSILEMVD